MNSKFYVYRKIDGGTYCRACGIRKGFTHLPDCVVLETEAEIAKLRDLFKKANEEKRYWFRKYVNS